ncbi:MAG TPA: DUF4157 domain-containing protein [Candidatus Angelobacter sp.]
MKSFVKPEKQAKQGARPAAQINAHAPAKERSRTLSPPVATNTDQGGLAHDFSRISIFPPTRLLIQRKLMVSAPGDAYEQEADSVAEQVLHMPQPQAAVVGPSAAAVSGSAPAVQRACACGGSCEDCKKKNKHEEPAKVQMKAAGPGRAGGMEAPPIVHEVVSSPGQPLDAGTRAFMEPRFGWDFSKVRVHTDEKAAESARAVGARAYTVGQNVVFGAGEYAPGRGEGQRLLGHELTHVVQQGGMVGQIAMRDPTPPGYGSSVSGAETLKPCPAAPPIVKIPSTCQIATPVPGAVPPDKESPVLPTLSDDPFGNDPNVENFANDLAACHAARVVKREVEKRFEHAVAEAKSAATKDVEKDIEGATADAVIGIDPKDKKSIAAAQKRAARDAKAAGAKKISDAQAAVQKPDIATVEAELTAKFKDELSADFKETMQAAFNRFGEKKWLRGVRNELADARTRITAKKQAKPNVKKGETPPPPRPPGEIAAEIESEMVKVRCEQDNWIENQVEAVKRGWMVGRREQIDFDTSAKMPALKEFAPRRHVSTMERVPLPVNLRNDPKDPGPSVAPEVIRFLLKLRRLEPDFTAETYSDHGLGQWKNAGFSLDLRLSGKKRELDQRGFYKHDNAVKFLLNLDQVAGEIGARWRVLYNDFTVADEINRHTGTQNVGFVGGTLRDKDNKVDLNWHGPDPMLLHFHLDIELPPLEKLPDVVPTTSP